jgi:hypothetical protein
MDKFVIVSEDWEEEILSRETNPFVFDDIIEQKVSQVRRIILPDPEIWWTLSINSKRIILIN